MYLKEIDTSVQGKAIVEQFNTQLQLQSKIKVQELVLLEVCNEEQWYRTLSFKGVPHSKYWLIEQHMEGYSP